MLARAAQLKRCGRRVYQWRSFLTLHQQAQPALATRAITSNLKASGAYVWLPATKLINALMVDKALCCSLLDRRNNCPAGHSCSAVLNPDSAIITYLSRGHMDDTRTDACG